MDTLAARGFPPLPAVAIRWRENRRYPTPVLAAGHADDASLVALRERYQMAADPDPHFFDPRRRAALGRLAVPAALAVAPGLTPLLASASAAAPLRPTPAQAEGPFYPIELPADTDADLLANGELRYLRGQAAWIEGTVVDPAGRPVQGAIVEIWQCDADGRYRHPGDGNRADPAFQAFGRTVVDREGGYRFRTLRPAAYAGRTPHIHVKVRLSGRTLLTTQLYVEGDPGNERDPLWRGLRDPADRAALTVPFRSGVDGLQARFSIVVVA
jgi:protocatechuate 3,4-dioxygenase, beta subunit